MAFLTDKWLSELIIKGQHSVEEEDEDNEGEGDVTSVKRETT